MLERFGISLQPTVNAMKEQELDDDLYPPEERDRRYVISFREKSVLLEYWFAIEAMPFLVPVRSYSCFASHSRRDRPTLLRGLQIAIQPLPRAARDRMLQLVTGLGASIVGSEHECGTPLQPLRYHIPITTSPLPHFLDHVHLVSTLLCCTVFPIALTFLPSSSLLFFLAFLSNA